MPVKSFRGKIAHNAQDTISLHTNTGTTGYRITKFEIMQIDPSEQPENTVKIYTVPQTTIDANVDFSDNTLLAAGMIWASTNQIYPHDKQIIFDNTTFNQDIYVTNFDEQFNAAAINYHIELEQIKLSLDENTVATLKDIRNIEASTL
tara:strand:- start:66 stop:509 length:444 start_codon:yes stop_codon:yes gene_type:complete